MRNLEVANTNIFESNSQLLSHDAADIRPLFDRLLLRDCKEPEKIGSIWIPETAAERGVGKEGRLRMGIVVAVGPGDPWAKEKVVKGTTQIIRKALGACRECNGEGRNLYSDVICPACGGDGIWRKPMYCKVGDTVIYDMRREAEIFLDGVRHVILHEEQAVLAILDGAAQREDSCTALLE